MVEAPKMEVGFPVSTQSIRKQFSKKIEKFSSYLASILKISWKIVYISKARQFDMQ